MATRITPARLDVFEAEGKTHRCTCVVVIRDATLYLAAEMTLQQQEGHSVFDYSLASYVKESRASTSLGYGSRAGCRRQRRCVGAGKRLLA